ncbi:MAG: hypothetical protein AAF235_00760 [Planctomycetota bacterium]
MSFARSMLCVAAVAGTAMGQSTLQVDDSTVGLNVGEPGPGWRGFMNVSDLAGNFIFNSGWGVADLSASFDDDAQTLTLGPTPLGDPSDFWYQNGSLPTGFGGPGADGNRMMNAVLFQQADGTLAGESLTFSASVLSDTFDGYEVNMFIRDFASDFGSLEESSVAIDGAGTYTVTLDAIDDATRFVQWGFEINGINVWPTDVNNFGNVVIGTIPTPGAAAVLGLGGLLAARRRR